MAASHLNPPITRLVRKLLESSACFTRAILRGSDAITDNPHRSL